MDIIAHIVQYFQTNNEKPHQKELVLFAGDSNNITEK